MDEVVYSAEALDLIDAFLAEYGRSARPAEVLARYCERYPEYADEFRQQADFGMIDPGAEPADLPDVSLLREIGRGGMGVVFEGWQESLDRPVAVKLHRLTDARPAREKFFHECRILARLHHSSIVPVHAAGRAGPWVYYVMPLIGGASASVLVRHARRLPRPLPPLSQVLDREAGPSEEAGDPGAEYLRSVASAMAMAADAIHHAHAEGIWHLDVKPSNLMVDPAGHCWIIDFGVARRAPDAADAATLTPGSDLTYLTLAYAAPERSRGVADARCDVWGLGATLFELLTLTRPFPSSEVATLRRSVAEDDVSPPVWLPADLAAICRKALSKRPEERYATAGEVAADLRAWSEGRETTARPWSPVVRQIDRLNRHRPWVIAATAALVGIVMTLSLLWVRATAENERLQADAKQQQANRDAADAKERADHEAELAARARVWAKVEEARDRLRRPTPGVREGVRQKLREAVRERRGLPPHPSDTLLDEQVRTLFVESLSTLDHAWEERDRAILPRFFAFDWPAALRPDGGAVAIGTCRNPMVWRRGDPPPTADEADVRKARHAVEYGRTGAFLAEMLCKDVGGGLRLWNGDASRMLGELLPEGSGVVLSVRFATEDSRLWAATSDGRVRGWSLPELKPLPDWPLASPRPATASAFDRDGARVVFGHEDGRVAAFDSAGATGVAFTTRPARRVEAVAWSPGGELLAVGTHDGTGHVHDAVGDVRYRVTVSASGVSRLVFSPDGQWLSGHYRSGGARTWAAHTGKEVMSGQVAVWGHSRDGRVAVASGPSELIFVDWRSPAVVRRHEGHRGSVHGLSWSEKNGRLASLSSDFEVRVWATAADGGLVAAHHVPPSAGFWAEQGAVALGKDGSTFAYASGGEARSTVLIREVEGGKSLGQWDMAGGFESLAAAEGGAFLLVREETRPDAFTAAGAREPNTVTTVAHTLRPKEPPSPRRVIREPEPGDVRRCFSAELTPDGRHYVWCGPRIPGSERRVELIDVATGRLLWRRRSPIARNDEDVTCTLSGDGSHAWVAFEGKAVLCPLSGTVPSREVPRMPAAASTDGKWLAAGRLPGDGSPRPCLSILRPGSEGVWLNLPTDDTDPPQSNQLRFSPDSRYLAWGELSGRVTIIDMAALEAAIAGFDAWLKGD